MSRVTIAYAHPGEVTAQFADSVMRVLMADADLEERRICVPGAGYMTLFSGPRIASARNTLVKNWLEFHESEWLWMLDVDITFDPTVLDTLLAAADPEKRPIVGGLYFAGGRGFIIPMLYEIVDPATNDGRPIRHITKWREGEVVKVDATGAGCLLVHRDAMTQIYEATAGQCFAESHYHGWEFGEDWTFCIRAATLGYPVHVATGAKCGHVKTCEFNEQLWRTGEIPLEWIGGRPAPQAESVPLNRQQRRALARA